MRHGVRAPASPVRPPAIVPLSDRPSQASSADAGDLPLKSAQDRLRGGGRLSRDYRAAAFVPAAASDESTLANYGLLAL